MVVVGAFVVVVVVVVGAVVAVVVVTPTVVVAVVVVVGEVGRPLVLGVLRAHLEAGDTDPSIHLTHNQEAIFVTNITNMCSLITHIQTRQKK